MHAKRNQRKKQQAHAEVTHLVRHLHYTSPVYHVSVKTSNGGLRGMVMPERFIQLADCHSHIQLLKLPLWVRPFQWPVQRRSTDTRRSSPQPLPGRLPRGQASPAASGVLVRSAWPVSDRELGWRHGALVRLRVAGGRGQRQAGVKAGPPRSGKGASEYGAGLLCVLERVMSGDLALPSRWASADGNLEEGVEHAGDEEMVGGPAGGARRWCGGAKWG